MSDYTRTAEIERARGADPGVVKGTLVTDGEASDGHILNIAGGKAEPGIPFLFAHEDGAFSSPALANLGSWESFDKQIGDGSLGSSRLRGTARFELDGSGVQAEWRQDVAHMTAAGHIRAFSVRWDADPKDVKRRANLPEDHPAFVNGDDASLSWRQRGGLYFEKWIALEGSLVSIGADPEALAGRIRGARGEVRDFWRVATTEALEAGKLSFETDYKVRVFLEALDDLRSTGLDDLVVLTNMAAKDGARGDLSQCRELHYGDGQIHLIPHAAYAALLESDRDRLRIAFDALLESDDAHTVDEVDEVTPEPERKALESDASKPANEPAPSLAQQLREAIAFDREAFREEVLNTVRKAYGRQ